jgi:hypothetical protein
MKSGRKTESKREPAFHKALAAIPEGNAEVQEVAHHTQLHLQLAVQTTRLTHMVEKLPVEHGAV